MLAMAEKLDKAMYTILEAAALLRVSDETVRRMIKAEQLDAVKVRGAWRIRRESLAKYLEPSQEEK